MIDLPSSAGCRRHRPVLLDFVDRGEIAERTADALAHLDRCDRCTAQLESTVLTIIALRRLGEDAARAEPPPDAWPRLRARLERWRPLRWSILSPSAGVVMSAAIVAVLIAPLQLGGPEPAASQVPGAAQQVLRPASPAERRIEAAYIANVQRGRFAEDAAVSLQGTTAGTSAGTNASLSIPRTYPDNIRREWKEVTPAEPSGRPPEAI